MLKINNLIGFSNQKNSGTGGSSPTIIPSDYSGLIFWCDADAGLASLSNTDPISTWNATVGSSPTQTGTARPTKNVVSGKNAAVFASQSLILGTTLDPSTDFTAFAKVYRGSTTFRAPILGNFANDNPVLYQRTNGLVYCVTATRYTYANCSATGWNTYIFTSSGASIAIYLNGVALTLTSNTAVSSPNPLDGLSVARSDRGTFSLRSVGWYNRVLNSTEISDLNTYLTNL